MSTHATTTRHLFDPAELDPARARAHWAAELSTLESAADAHTQAGDDYDDEGYVALAVRHHAYAAAIANGKTGDAAWDWADEQAEHFENGLVTL